MIAFQHWTLEVLALNTQNALDQLYASAIGEQSEDAIGIKRGYFSDVYCSWSGREFLDKTGKRFPLTYDPDRNNVERVAHRNKIYRVERFFSEYFEHGGQKPIDCDFGDAREFGRVADNRSVQSIFAYVRRHDAKNVKLWPLAGYHDIGCEGFISQEPVDDIAFEDKADVCFWRGALVGRTVPELLPSLISPTGTGRIFRALRDDTSIANQVAGEIALGTVVRYRVCAEVEGNPDFDVGYVAGDHFRDLRELEFISRYVKPRVSQKNHYRYRYLLSLSGHDTASNFPVLLNSNSLVFKEDDGWEVFFSRIFKPWIHFVPLKRGAVDLEEKLDWARSNPKTVKDIIAEAQRTSSFLGNRQLRAELLKRLVSSV